MGGWGAPLGPQGGSSGIAWGFSSRGVGELKATMLGGFWITGEVFGVPSWALGAQGATGISDGDQLSSGSGSWAPSNLQAKAYIPKTDR